MRTFAADDAYVVSLERNSLAGCITILKPTQGVSVFPDIKEELPDAGKPEVIFGHDKNKDRGITAALSHCLSPGCGDSLRTERRIP